jgi:hypothetical protein
MTFNYLALYLRDRFKQRGILFDLDETFRVYMQLSYLMQFFVEILLLPRRRTTTLHWLSIKLHRHC